MGRKDPSPAFGLIAALLLVLANGFFVATELAIVAVGRSQLEQLEAEGRAAALMTPRTELEAVPADTPLDELLGRVALNRPVR